MCSAFNLTNHNALTRYVFHKKIATFCFTLSSKSNGFFSKSRLLRAFTVSFSKTRDSFHNPDYHGLSRFLFQKQRFHSAMPITTSFAFSTLIIQTTLSNPTKFYNPTTLSNPTEFYNPTSLPNPTEFYNPTSLPNPTKTQDLFLMPSITSFHGFFSKTQDLFQNADYYELSRFLF